MLHIVCFFILKNLFDEAVEILVVVLNQTFQVFMVTYHRFNGLSKLFILKHQRQHTQAYYLGGFNHLLVHGVKWHEETYQEEFRVEAIRYERGQFSFYESFRGPQATRSQLVIDVVEILLLQKLQKSLSSNDVFRQTIVVRVFFHQQLWKGLTSVVEQVDLVEKQLQFIDIEFLL